MDGIKPKFEASWRVSVDVWCKLNDERTDMKAKHHRKICGGKDWGNHDRVRGNEGQLSSRLVIRTE